MVCEMSSNRDLERAGIALEMHRPKVAAALAFIAEHFREPVTVDEIAAAGSYSQRGLQDAFRRDIDRTPTDIIIELRLRAARDLLLHGRGAFTVQEVATKVSMPHAGRFADRYRELFNETPRQTLRPPKR